MTLRDQWQPIMDINDSKGPMAADNAFIYIWLYGPMTAYNEYIFDSNGPMTAYNVYIYMTLMDQWQPIMRIYKWL